VPGQVFYNTTRKLVLKGADGLVFVADSQRKMMDANVESYGNLEQNLIEHGMKLPEIPHILQFNKRDLPDVASVEQMNALLNKHNAPIYEAVATTGIGVQETLKAVTRLVLNSLKEKYGEGRRAEREPAAAPVAVPAAVSAAPAVPAAPVAPVQAARPPAPPPPPVIVEVEEPVEEPILEIEPEPPPPPPPRGAVQEPVLEIEVEEPVLSLQEEPPVVLADAVEEASPLAIEEPAAAPIIEEEPAVVIEEEATLEDATASGGRPAAFPGPRPDEAPPSPLPVAAAEAFEVETASVDPRGVAFPAFAEGATLKMEAAMQSASAETRALKPGAAGSPGGATREASFPLVLDLQGRTLHLTLTITVKVEGT
jgi:hypothetical protein